MADNFSLKNAKALSETYNDKLPTSFKEIIAGCTNGEFFSPEKPMNKLSSWKDYYYLGDPTIIDVRFTDGITQVVNSSIIEVPGKEGIYLDSSCFPGFQKMQGPNIIENSYVQNDKAGVKITLEDNSWCSLTTKKYENQPVYGFDISTNTNYDPSTREADLNILVYDTQDESSNKIYTYILRQIILPGVNLPFTLRYSRQNATDINSYEESSYAIAFKLTINGEGAVTSDHASEFETSYSRSYDITCRQINTTNASDNLPEIYYITQGIRYNTSVGTDSCINIQAKMLGQQNSLGYWYKQAKVHLYQIIKEIPSGTNPQDINELIQNGYIVNANSSNSEQYITISNELNVPTDTNKVTYWRANNTYPFAYGSTFGNMSLRQDIKGFLIDIYLYSPS